MTDGDDLFDVTEAASYLTVSSRTLYREVARGRLRITKVGGSTRLRRSELDRYLRSQERGRSRVS